MTRRRPPAAVLGGVAVGALICAAAWLLYSGRSGTGPADADGAVLAGFLDARSPGLTTAVVALTNAGGTAAMALLTTACVVVSSLRRRWLDAAFLAVTALGASLVFQLLKGVLGRPRPPVVDRLVAETNESLPSGHATMSVAVIGALVVLAWTGRTAAGRGWLLAAAVTWVVAVGASRLYLGVHWFSDVLAGWLVGGAWLALCVAGRAWLRHRATAPSG